MLFIDAITKCAAQSDVQAETDGKPLIVMRQARGEAFFAFMGLAAQLYEVTMQGEPINRALVQKSWLDADWLFFEIVRNREKAPAGITANDLSDTPQEGGPLSHWKED